MSWYNQTNVNKPIIPANLSFYVRPIDGTKTTEIKRHKIKSENLSQTKNKTIKKPALKKPKQNTIKKMGTKKGNKKKTKPSKKQVHKNNFI